MAELFKGVGIDNLPTGIAALRPRERAFCLNYLRTGLWTESARAAGYAHPDKHAHSLRKNVGISTFLSKAAQALTEETKQLVIRVEERSRALQQLLRDELEKPPERRRAGRITRYAAAVNRTDALLGALKNIGKVGHVTVDATHQHQGEVAITVPATALPVLAQLRRDVVEARTGGLN